MVTAVKFNSLGERMEEIELPASIFDVDVDSPKVLLHEVITMYLGNQRQGTVQKKSRGMVQGSTRKLFRQKAQATPAWAAAVRRSACMVEWLLPSARKIGIVRFRARKSAWL